MSSITRSTWHGRLNSLARQTSRITDALGKAQTRAATGLDYTRPSDAPERTGRIHRMRGQLEDQARFEQMSGQAMELLDVADSALDGLTDVLANARALAVQLGSDTLTDQDRVDGATSARGLMSQAVDRANSQLAGRYVLAGSAYDAPAYASDGTYEGSTDEPELAVGEGVQVRVGFDGSDLLQGDGDLFGALDELITALDAGDADLVTAAIDGLEDATRQVSNARTSLGIEMRTALDGQELATSLQLELQAGLSSLTEADVVEAYTELTELQATYEAALQMTIQGRNQSLFKML